jgi:hypothetical protein
MTMVYGEDILRQAIGHDNLALLIFELSRCKTDLAIDALKLKYQVNIVDPNLVQFYSAA